MFDNIVDEAGLAQSVERVTAEREVVASIRGAGPILKVCSKFSFSCDCRGL